MLKGDRRMSTQLSLENFEEIYNSTYSRTLKYIICKYIKKKDIKVIKVFYLYYCLELKISQIAEELTISESNVKNILYRTIKDIKENIKIEGDMNV